MTWIMVDIEADGPIPGEYSMVSLGAVVVEPGLGRTFYGQLRPISEQFVPEALQVSGHTRQECLAFPKPEATMQAFAEWLRRSCGTRRDRRGEPPLPDAWFISDNNGFDWMFVCYYFWRFVGGNPFGHSSTNLGSLYKGLAKSMFKSFKHLRKTRHTHHPVDDARGNAEALLAMQELGLEIKL